LMQPVTMQKVAGIQRIGARASSIATTFNA
jgi:hypothetical protein